MDAGQAKYQMVIDWVKKAVRDGELKEGDQLPTEMELAEKFDLSRQTVRHATGELEKDGVVVRMRGSGTYIRKHDQKKDRSQQILPVRSPVHRNIAVISTYVDSYIFPPVIRGIESVLSREDYTMQVAFTDDNISREGMIINQLLQHDTVDGVIAEPSMSLFPNPNLDAYRELRSRGIPVLFFNDQYDELDFPCIRIDDEKAAFDMTNVLIEAGHKNIAGIFHSGDGQGARRYSGYLKAKTRAGLAYEREHIIFVDSLTLKNISEAENLLMNRIRGCTAVFCYNDEIAYQLIPLLEKHGIRVPQDMSITAIDNVGINGKVSTRITTYDHPKGKLGQKAAENLLKLLEDPSFDANYIYRGTPLLLDSVKRFPSS